MGANIPQLCPHVRGSQNEWLKGEIVDNGQHGYIEELLEASGRDFTI